MGLDVNLYVTGEVSEFEAAQVDAMLTERCSNFVDDFGRCWVGFVPTDGYGPRRWVVQTLARYYGEGYERGNWPVIYSAIALLRLNLPDREVHYGADCDDPPAVTDASLAAIWTHWAGPSGKDYYLRE